VLSNPSFIVDSLYRKAKEAIAARAEHVAAFIEFSGALPQHYTKEWTAQCIAWEKDRSQLNPYELPEKNVTTAEVRLRLAKEESEGVEVRDGPSFHSVITPGMLIYQGLELEDLQYVI
jgi:hypothetical protein